MKKILLVSVTIIIISIAVFMTSSDITASGKESINSYSDSFNRPQVVKITVELSNGEIHQIDPKENVAMFWGYNTVEGTTRESAASAILGSFYDNFKVNITMTREKFEKFFGKQRTNAIFPEESDKILLNKELVRKVWDMPDESGTLKSYIVKKPRCYFGF